MTRNNPMTQSERQIKLRVVTTPLKQYGKRRKPLTPPQDIGNATLQVVVDKAISLLDGTLCDGKAEDMFVVARNVYDMLFNARKEMSQEKGQEDMRKKTHDPTATPSSVARVPAKEKAPVKKKARK